MSIILKNYINGKWVESNSPSSLNVINPANGKILWKVPSGAKSDVVTAAEKADMAWPSWRNTPATQRIQYLFKMKQILKPTVMRLLRYVPKNAAKHFQNQRLK